MSDGKGRASALRRPHDLQKCFVFDRQIFLETAPGVEREIQKSLRSPIIWVIVFMVEPSWLMVLITAILSGFPRLFYPFRGFWNSLYGQCSS
jgi:hypothetical protein